MFEFGIVLNMVKLFISLRFFKVLYKSKNILMHLITKMILIFKIKIEFQSIYERYIYIT